VVIDGHLGFDRQTTKVCSNMCATLHKLRLLTDVYKWLSMTAIGFFFRYDHLFSYRDELLSVLLFDFHDLRSFFSLILRISN
jgi:hypothetical protein